MCHCVCSELLRGPSLYVLPSSPEKPLSPRPPILKGTLVDPQLSPVDPSKLSKQHPIFQLHCVLFLLASTQIKMQTGTPGLSPAIFL